MEQERDSSRQTSMSVEKLLSWIVSLFGLSLSKNQNQTTTTQDVTDFDLTQSKLTQNNVERDKVNWKFICELAVAVATIGLFVINIFSLGLFKEQVIKGQRAYLVFQRPAVAVVEGIKPHEKPRIEIPIFNSGQTPAKDISYAAALYISLNEDPILGLSTPRSFGYLGAGKDANLRVEMMEELTEQEFNEITIAEFSMNGKILTQTLGRHLWVRVFVSYKDVFDEPRNSSICMVYNINRFVYCASGSDFN